MPQRKNDEETLGTFARTITKGPTKYTSELLQRRAHSRRDDSKRRTISRDALTTHTIHDERDARQTEERGFVTRPPQRA